MVQTVYYCPVVHFLNLLLPDLVSSLIGNVQFDTRCLLGFGVIWHKRDQTYQKNILAELHIKGWSPLPRIVRVSPILDGQGPIQLPRSELAVSKSQNWGMKYYDMVIINHQMIVTCPGFICAEAD